MKQNLLYGISKHLKVNACVSVNQVILVLLLLQRSVFELAHDPITGGHICTKKTTDKSLAISTCRAFMTSPIGSVGRVTFVKDGSSLSGV